MRLPVLFTVEFVLASGAVLTLARWVAPRRFSARLPRALLLAGVVSAGVATVFLDAKARAYTHLGGGPYRLPVAATRTWVFVLITTGLAVLAARLGFALADLRARVANAIRQRKTKQVATRPGPVEAPAPAPAPCALTRREVAQRAIAVGATVGSTALWGYGAKWLRREVRVREHEVYVPGLPAGLEGLTLVQITDIHMGIFAGPRDYEPVIEHVRRLRPDLVVLTGDLLDHESALVPEAMALFSRTRGRRGTYAIAGNHDHYTGVESVFAGLRAAGITALDNQSVWLPGGGNSPDSGLVLAGLDDLYAPRYTRGRKGPDLARALRGVSPEAPRVVLSHNPVTFLDTAPHCALQLSGHTHGGQVNAAGVVHLAMRFVSGFYAGPAAHPESLLFVSNGLGFTGPPVRISAPAEVVLLGLTGRAGRGVRRGALPG